MAEVSGQQADFKIPKFDAEILIEGDEFGTRDYKPQPKYNHWQVFRVYFTKHHDDDEKVYFFLYDPSQGLSSLAEELDVWVA